MGGYCRWFLSRRDVVLGGLALVAAGATRQYCEAAAAKSYFRRHRQRQQLHLQDATSPRSTRNGTSRSSNISVSEPLARWSSIRATTCSTSSWRTRRRSATASASAREGFKWYGRATIDRKALWPKWIPPPEMLERQPGAAAPSSTAARRRTRSAPRAMYLHRNGADTGYRLHGTLEPWSIGTDASSGCIRMFPETSSTSTSAARSARPCRFCRTSPTRRPNRSCRSIRRCRMSGRK